MVEIPTYHNTTVSSAVQVQFYVCNGKRRRSQTQNFTYLAGASPHHYPTAIDCAVVASRVKQEHGDSAYLSTCTNPPGLYPTSNQLTSPDGAFSQDRPLYGSSGGHPVPCDPPSQAAFTPSGSSPLQHSPHLHSYSPGMGYQRISLVHTPDPMPPLRTRPVYQVTQHNVPYSGQASSPMRPGPAAPQVNRPQSAQTRPAASSPHREMYQSLIGPDLSIATLQSARTHTQNATQLQSLKYHCSHSDSDLAALQAEYNLSYHSDKNLPASYSPTPGVAATCSTSPLASASSGGPLRHLSPSSAQGLASGIDPQECPPAPHSLFSNDRGRVNIKQEPEEKLPLGSMGLQEITLDDGKRLI